MFNKNNQIQKSPEKRFLFILGLLIFICYFALGMVLIFRKDILPQFENPYRMIFGIMVIVYAFFRFMRLMQAKRD
jgi:cytochrome c biogenesis protein CcdA